MKRSMLRPLALGLVTLTTTATMTVTAVSSHAAPTGSLSFSPATGSDTTAMVVTTSAACPASATNLQVIVTGTGFPAAPTGINAVGNSPISAYPVDATSGGHVVALSDTFADFAAQQTPPAQLSGQYDFDLFCRGNISKTHLADFTGSIVFTKNASTGALTYALVQQAQTTTTAIGASPASPVDSATPVTFTAVVSPATATGTVQFFDGATAIGSPTAVDANGMATLTQTLSAGSHNVTAAFTGSSPAISGSTSSALPYTVTQAAATATSTALVISPASATAADDVTLSATVSAASGTPAGKVQFKDGGSNLGAPVAFGSGTTATFVQTYSAGTHSFTATFVPTNPGAFASSTSTSQDYTVGANTNPNASETLETKVVPGSLTISVDSNPTVVLPSPVLNADATFLTTNGAINPVTVTDTRAGNPGWTVSGQVTDFHNTVGADTTPINGFNLGWTPNVGTHSLSQTITAGALVSPASPVLDEGATPADPTQGLRVSRTLASAAAGQGTGTAHLGADLALNVPTTVIAGTYDATLTLTAIGN